MPQHYRIDGVATIGGRVDGMGTHTLPPMPARITMDPAGIDLFHVLLQLLYAHAYSPYPVAADAPKAAVEEHWKAAWAFLHENVIHHRHGCKVQMHVEYPTPPCAQYTIQHVNRPAPLVVQVDPRKSFHTCLAMAQPDGTFVTIDLRTIHVPPPARR